MTDELTDAFPQESESQRIGRLADKCFQANSPNSWIITRIDGGNDYGYDYMVQVTTAGLVKDSFRVQLKGASAPSLDAAGTRYSVSLDLSTVNYYALATEPVLLVVCNLGVDIDRPTNCPLYFQWIQDDLRRIREKGVVDGQKSVSFHIPVGNVLDGTTDLVGDIARHRRLSKLGEQLDVVIERDKPMLTALERAELASKFAPGLEQRSAALVDALAEEPTTSWVEADEGSLQWYLREASNALRFGNGGQARRAIKDAEGLLGAAKPLEKADYWHVVGRLRAFCLDDAGAADAFKEASNLSGNASRHLVAWAEAELRVRFQPSGENDFGDVIARLAGSEPSIVAMRARLISAEGRHADALALAQSIGGVEGIAASAIILTMLIRREDTIAACNAGLALPLLRDSTKQLFLILRARAKFALATGGFAANGPDTYLPLTGPAGADPRLLRETWSDIAQLVESLRLSGWPGNVELVSDIWSATAAMLGHQEAALPLMAEAAAARPSLPTLQAALEALAAQVRNFALALDANSRQPNGDAQTLRRISLLHLGGRHRECADLMASREDALPLEHSMLGFATGLAILSAERIVRPDLATRWEQRLESRPELAPHLALLRYFRSFSQNFLAKDAALSELERQYQLLGRPEAIATQVFHELDATDIEQAERCVEYAKKMGEARLLDMEGSTHLAQALTTLARWNELLDLSNQALLRFDDNDRLSAIGALALDKLGRSGEAHTRLKSLIGKADPDALALNAYIGIASRSGFTSEAVACIERVLATEQDRARQIECLRHLFSLIHLSEPAAPRLVEIAWEIGKRADPNDEAQEGLFLMAIFTATLPADMPLGEARKAEFQRRLETFIGKFPNSKIIRRATLPSDASATDLKRAIDEVIGVDEGQRRWRVRIQNELERGVAPIPYAWRPRHVLDGILDLPTLWEISKASRWEDRQLHLTMAQADWRAVPLAEMRGNVPLIDLTSLLVLDDLNLFDSLFQLFPRIAIGKATLIELQKLLSPMSGCPFRQKCLHLQGSLQARFQLIEQPGIEPPKGDSVRTLRWASEEIVEAARSRPYMIFADDLLFRMYADPPTSNPPSICTLDLLLALDESGILTAVEVAKHIATLCSWRVGLVIPTRYQIAIIPEALRSAHGVGEGIDILRGDLLCSALFNGLWDPRKPYSELQGHAGSLLRDLVGDPNNRIESVSSLVGLWLGKARLHKNAPTPVTRAIAFLIVQAAFDERPVSPHTSHRLWSVYRALVEFEHGERMDDDKYRDAIRVVGEVAAETDQKYSLGVGRSMRERLTQGLTGGTSDYDRFNSSYANALVAMAKPKQSRPTI